MKKIIFTILFLTLVSQTFSQDGYRIRLLANIDPHPISGTGYSALWGYTAPNSREYAILGTLNGTSFIDITDTTNIHEVDYLPSDVNASIWREMKTYSHYAYIVSESGGSCIQIADLQYLPDSIRYVGRIILPGHSSTHSISQSGPYLYLNGGNSSFTSGVRVVDLSVNPEVPVLRGKWDNLYVHDSRIVNDTIWACNISNGKVSIIDARNKDSLKTIRDWVNIPQPNSPHNIAFTNNRHYAFVTDEVFSPPGRLKIWNVSDLSNITYIKSFDPTPFETADVHNIEIYNNFAFLAYYAAGVKVLNISDPENPVEIGWYDTHPEDNSGNGCWAVYFFPTGKIIASDMGKGLFVLKPNLNDPVSAMPVVNFTKPQPEIPRRDSIRLIDMTEGIPVSWQWTVSGPQTKTSTLKHPKFALDSIGLYTVKLKATNSFGSDSLVKTNFFRVVNAPLPAFSVVNPVNLTRIITSPFDTSRFFFNWNRSVNSPDVVYKLLFKKVTGATEIGNYSGNSGRDTFALLTRSYLDSVALQSGVTGDSVVAHFKARAYLGGDSATSGTVLIILKRNTTGISGINELIPREFKLHNNFPNPFNPVTNIKFDIPKNSNVKIVVYDIAGKEVEVLVSQEMKAGSYNYSFDAGKFSSGIYYVRLSAEDFNSVIKIALIK